VAFACLAHETCREGMAEEMADSAEDSGTFNERKLRITTAVCNINGAESTQVPCFLNRHSDVAGFTRVEKPDHINKAHQFPYGEEQLQISTRDLIAI
jgi:hypothetical protein